VLAEFLHYLGRGAAIRPYASQSDTPLESTTIHCMNSDISI